MHLSVLLPLLCSLSCFGLLHLERVRRDLSLPRVAMIRRCASSSPISDASDILVMINGLPGPMALETSKACIDRGLKIATSALTGPTNSPKSLEIKVEAEC